MTGPESCRGQQGCSPGKLNYCISNCAFDSDSPTLNPRAIFRDCLIDTELQLCERKPFEFATIAFPAIIHEVMMKCPLPLAGQQVAIATDHYTKFINSAGPYPKVADS